MEQWRFRIAAGGYCCADCGAEVWEDREGGLVMKHEEGCAQVAALRRGQQ